MPSLAILLITTLLSQPASPPGTPGQNNRGNRNSPQQAAQRFDQLDRNKDGVLTKDEVRRREFFERADANNDGKITREEAAALASNAQRRPGQGNQTRPGNTTQANTQLQITRDLPYVKQPADRAKQSLDIYAHDTDTPKPVMIYIHGGGWSGGDKTPGAQDKAKLLATQGWMLVSINYRLSPAITHPAHVQDVAAAVAWIHDNIEDYGGNPERMVVMGHSAGAHLAALVATDQKRLAAHGKSLDILDGAILLDGAAYDLPAMLALDALPDKSRTTHERWATTNPRLQADASPTLHVKAGIDIPPFLILHIDRPLGTLQSNQLAQRLEDAGVPSVVLLCKDETHGSMNTDLGTPDHLPTEAIQLVLEGMAEPPNRRRRRPGN